jgi:hypothetical protein
MKFETRRWSDARLLEDFLGFDFRNGQQPSGVLRNFLKQYELTHLKAIRLQESLRDDVACVLTGNRYQPVKMTLLGPQLSGVASVEELLKKIEQVVPKPMWRFAEQDRTVHMIPVSGVRPEQRLYQIVLSLLIDRNFWKLGVCRYCGRIFWGTKYCGNECREAWHNRYTRAPRVIRKRAEEKAKTLNKKARRKRPKKVKPDLGMPVFEEFKALHALEQPSRAERDRLAWIKDRLFNSKIATDLPWDALSKEHKKQFRRIAEMEL